MSLNGFLRPATDGADDLDVPGFMKPAADADTVPLTIPGELVHAADSGDEDGIPPGVIEYYTPRPPMLSQAGSAAMVVASTTGRAVGLTARGGWNAARWFGVGLGSVCYLGYRYVRAHDTIGYIGGITSKADLSTVKKDRRSRWKLLFWTPIGLTAFNLTGWWALVKYAGMTALDYSWAVLPSVESATAVAALTLYGRYRLTTRLAPQQIIAPDDVDDGEEPYPLAWCTNGQQVIECAGRAFYAEGLDTRRIDLKAQYGWGKELDIDLKGCTPGDVNARLAEIDTHLDIPQGGTMIEPDPRRSAHITLRLVESNPFADMPRPAVHPPRSLSVHDTVAMGRAMDGSSFELTLDGFCALVIGAMGAGKTLGALRTLAEALTACTDAVCWDLDPLKGGLAEFGDLMEVRARGAEECEEALERALKFVTARSTVMPRIKGMGDRWKASPTHPHLYAFVDEYLQLSPRGKELAIKILRTGRQYGIYLVMAGQEATSDALGDAIAGVVPYRIAMACRFEDVRIMFGVGKGAQGWRPDRMEPAVGEIINDAGQSFIMGGGFKRAIRYRFNGYSREQITQAVPERLAAGLARMDADTLLEAGEGLASGGQRATLADRLDDLATRGGVEDARLVAVLLREFELSGEAFLPTTERLLPALYGVGFEGMDGGKLGRLLKAQAPDVVSTREEWEGRPQVRGWRREAVEKAAAGLIDPSTTRLEAG